MKTQTSKFEKDIFNVFVLLNEEMINVRGGDGDGEPIVLPNPPPVVL
jgi:hypothetical protein